jgi:hypothetical protein
MSSILGEWREGKVRPIPGNTPHGRPVSRGIFSLWSICDDPFRTTRFPQRRILPGPAVGVFLRHGGIYLVRCGQSKTKTKNLSRDRAASRRSAPGPGKGTRREEHVPSHRPQMSSGRLFLDRVARQHCPSPLHRHRQINTHSATTEGKGDISLLKIRSAMDTREYGPSDAHYAAG